MEGMHREFYYSAKHRSVWQISVSLCEKSVDGECCGYIKVDLSDSCDCDESGAGRWQWQTSY